LHVNCKTAETSVDISCGHPPTAAEP